MQYNKEKWIAAVQKSVKDLNTNSPTGGKATAIASIRFMRDGLLDDMGPAKKDDKEALAFITTVKECFSELIKQISKDGADSGFASNASAAAKAAGFKAANIADVVVED